MCVHVKITIVDVFCLSCVFTYLFGSVIGIGNYGGNGNVLVAGIFLLWCSGVVAIVVTVLVFVSWII